jgi:Ankyrin repeats (3 copies)
MFKFLSDRKTQSFIEDARKGNLSAVQEFIKKSKDVDATDKDGKTALMIAAAAGHRAVVEALLSAGAGLNKTDEPGRTPLMLAAEQGHLEISRLLISAGSDLKLKDQNGMTVFTLANSKGQSGLVKELICERDPAAKRLVEEGPADPESRATFLWLRNHEGTQVKVTFRTSKEKFLEDNTTWVISPPDLQIAETEQGEQPLLEYRIGIWELHPGNLKLPSGTFCEVENNEKSFTYRMHYAGRTGALTRANSKEEATLWKSYTFTLSA